MCCFCEYKRALSRSLQGERLQNIGQNINTILPMTRHETQLGSMCYSMQTSMDKFSAIQHLVGQRISRHKSMTKTISLNFTRWRTLYDNMTMPRDQKVRPFQYITTTHVTMLGHAHNLMLRQHFAPHIHSTDTSHKALR